MKVDIKKLVEDIKSAEESKRKGDWIKWGTEKGIGYPWKHNNEIWCGMSYEDFVTGLYTLRAFLRGKMHRQNPPAPLRDFHRSMIQIGEWDKDREIKWDMHEHNKKIAEEFASRYQKEDMEMAV